MKAYKVVSGVVQIGEGSRIGLGRHQAEPRAHRLTPVEGSMGVYVAASVLQFRAGEIIGLESLADLGKTQLDQIAEATPAEIQAMIDEAKRLEAANRTAKAATKDKGRPQGDSKAAIAAAREEGRKAGHAAGFKAGEAQGNEAGYKAGFEEGKSAGMALAWTATWEASADLKAQFATAQAYIEAQASAA